MPGERTRFNVDWVNPEFNSEWSAWLQPVKDNDFSAFCKFCCKRFSLSNMGVQAVKSHSTSIFHQKRQKSASGRQVGIDSMFHNIQKPHTSPSYDQSTPKPPLTTIRECSDKLPVQQPSLTTVGACSQKLIAQQPAISGFLNKESVGAAEILWALRLVMTQSSYNSGDGDSALFTKMFPDSDIAKRFTLGRMKAAYLVTYGLAPYFNNQLHKSIEKCSEYVISFDEALNKVAQRGQMDLHIRFWNEEQSQVSTRYMKSVFLGHATAADLLLKFKEGCGTLPLKNILQISMDGPNVNWKFLNDFKADLDVEPDDPKLIEIGSCGLHIVHGALQTGHKRVNWNVNAFLRGGYYLFKDSPARRADYTAITDGTLFPMRFCQVRWVENVSCIERAITVFKNLKKYVTTAKLPINISTGNVTTGINDPLMLAKLSFFKTVAAELESFLRKFQSAEPMTPFLHHELSDLVKRLMRRFVKAELVEAATTSKKLLDLDLSENENLRAQKDIGFGAQKYLNENRNISECRKGEFRMECRKFLAATVAKILERSPLKYSLIRGVSAFDPVIIFGKPVIAQERFETCLKILHKYNRVSEVLAERSKQQFISFCQQAKDQWKENFQTYIEERSRLDIFFASLLKNEASLKDLWSVTKMVLILSHGNGQVEAGFSINKGLLVENLQEDSIIALRQVYDGVANNGGIQNIQINKSLLGAVTGSRARYQSALEEKQKTRKEAEIYAEGRKRKLAKLRELKNKRSKLTKDLLLEREEVDKEIMALETTLQVS